MVNLLGEQLLRAGLVNKDKLNKTKKSRYRQQKMEQKKQGEVVSEAAESARRAAAEKAARDRELNRQQREVDERKAVQAQIFQLIEMNCLPRGEGKTAYNFQDGVTIKRFFVSSEIRDKLGRGLLAIVRFNDGYEVIPSVVAEKIKLRDESCIVGNAVTQSENGDDDPYADYRVPDDLMW